MLMTCSGRPGLRLRPAARRIAACIALGVGFVIGALGPVPPAAAQVVDHRGTEFLLPFLPNEEADGIVEVHLVSDVQTQVTLTHPVVEPTFTTTVDLTPGDATIVSLPLDAAQGWQAGSIQNNTVRAVGNAPFAVSMTNRGPTSGDAALALPVDALSTRYRVLTWFPLTGFLVSPAPFVVVATSDGTEVTITPTSALEGGYAANEPFTLVLNRGEGFFGQSGDGTETAGDASGTLIEASSPVAVTVGNAATQIPLQTGSPDHLLAFAPPIPSWGTEIIAAPVPQRPNGSAYRIIAAEDNTSLEVNGTFRTVLDAGEIDTFSSTGPQVFRADKPILAVQFTTGNEAPGADGGDPAMTNLIPTDQFLSTHTFSTVGGEQFTTNYITIVAASEDAAGNAVTLNDSPIDASLFAPIEGTGFSYAVEPVPPGTFTTASPSPHGVTVSGFGDAEAYLYPAGVQFDLSEPVVDTSPPVCEGSLDGSTFFGSVRDDGPNDTGVVAVELGADSFNLRLDVPTFPPGDRVVSFEVSQEDPTQIGLGAVIGRDGAGNECSVTVELPGSSPIRVSPAALAFGRQQVGRLSDPQTLVIENVSGSAVEIQSVEVAPPGPFVITEDTGETSLAPNERRTLQVEFRPSREGAFSASLTVSTNAGPSVASLDGTGLSLRVTAQPEAGTGQDVPVSADLPDDFSPQTRLLCYRPGGASDFTCDDLPPPVSTLQAKSIVAGAIPAAATTERGVEYYLSFEEIDDGTTTALTFPAVAPDQSPSQVRVRFDALRAAGAFAPQSYRMISVPASLEDPSVAGVLFDDYGPPDVRAWRLVQWNAAAEVYEEILNPNAVLEPGRGYWLISRSGQAFDVAAGRSTNLQVPVVRTLSPGWHQIASPFAFPVPWSSVEGSNQVEGPFLFDGEGGFLPNQTTLEPWNGYFVRNPSSESVLLRIPARPEPAPVPTQAQPASGAPPTIDAAPGYALTLSVSLRDGRRDARNVVGTHPAAQDGWDRLDISEPPPIGPHVRLSVVDGKNRLSQSFRAAGGEGQTWDLEIATSEVRAQPTEAFLTLGGVEDIPDGHRVFVVDVAAGVPLPRTGSRVRIPLPPGTQPVRLQFIVGTDAFARTASDGAALLPLRTELLAGYPNPLREGSSVLPYTLSAAGRVQIDVYDLLGRRVRRLVDATRPAGRYTARWDARSDRGRPVASGVYFLRLRAAGQTTVQKVVVLR
jgi:hypothetical protein